MTAPNKPWCPTLKDISDTFMKTRGNVSAAANYYNVSRDTMYEFLKANPLAREALEKARNHHSEDELDLAINLNYHFMQDYKNNPGRASRHVMYTLDKKGNSRGYTHSDTPDDSNSEFKRQANEKLDAVLDQVTFRSNRKIPDSNNSNAQKS